MMNEGKREVTPGRFKCVQCKRTNAKGEDLGRWVLGDAGLHCPEDGVKLKAVALMSGIRAAH